MGNVSTYKNVLGVVLCIGMAMHCFAQSAGELPQTELPAAVDETMIPIAPASPVATGDAGDHATLWLFVRMVLVLAVVAGCIYFVIWFMRRSMRTANAHDPFLRVVSTVTLAPGKSVRVVTLLDHAYVIGVTDSAVNLIGEVTDKELVDAMNLYADRQERTEKPRSFSDVLAIFLPRGSANKQTVFDDDGSAPDAFLRRQRSRLRDGE
ncbi:MAG: flagellar biosynthetic protein FliO [Treponema sp.]|nr:flagellar biosynthetic protein FliO [Treponema sp.]